MCNNVDYRFWILLNALKKSGNIQTEQVLNVQGWTPVALVDGWSAVMVTRCKCFSGVEMRLVLVQWKTMPHSELLPPPEGQLLRHYSQLWASDHSTQPYHPSPVLSAQSCSYTLFRFFLWLLNRIHIPAAKSSLFSINDFALLLSETQKAVPYILEQDFDM